MLKKGLIFLVSLLAFLLFVILVIPVALLPKASAVPVYFWLPLLVIDLALFVIFFAVKPLQRGIIWSLAGGCLVAIAAVLFSQAYAMTPPIVDAQGNPVLGSIATLEKVELNGSLQWISIRGADTSNPILLFLAGGPGGSQMTAERFALPGLEDHFVVVNWDQPGSGKSFHAMPKADITVDRYIEDGHALITYLKERFGQEKVFVLGESWGSALGVMMAQRYPEDFHALMGTGQMVAFLETDLTCYEFSMKLAEERGDQAKMEKLLKQGPPPYYGRGMSLKEATFLMDTYAFMNQDPNIYEGNTNTFRDLGAPEYGIYDKLNWFRGVLDTMDAVYPQLWDVDFRKDATRLDVPVYFLIGRHDINAPVKFTEDYYNILQAPKKEIVWFEHSGHNPWVNESDLFEQVVIEKVLAETLSN